MQRLEVSGVVQLIYRSLGVKGLNEKQTNVSIGLIWLVISNSCLLCKHNSEHTGSIKVVSATTS
jgi:hypothetical protein